uniref:Retrovirus-related Pol polyprotein from transposon TNT 1-94-like beta-barrel domain-containing protein n=1 Tax=Oryza glaberrima TaxID=4538 RepID=A0A679BCU5_ORYGL|nr:hypothetical protein [Oryza glaberrima]BBF89484.1 hypothetical protein [Oryza glaberrima]
MASYPVFQVSPEEAAKGKWYMATAATNHMTRDQSLISDLKPVTGRVVSRGNGAGLKVHGSGAVNTETVAIPDVWHVPGINANLVSVPQLSLLGLNISFDRGGCTVTRASDASVVGKARRSGAIYENLSGIFQLLVKDLEVFLNVKSERRMMLVMSLAMSRSDEFTMLD